MHARKALLVVILLLSNHVTISSHRSKKKTHNYCSFSTVATLLIGATLGGVATYMAVKPHHCSMDVETAKLNFIEEMRMSYLSGYMPKSPYESPFVGKNGLYEIYVPPLMEHCGKLAREEKERKKK